MAIYDIINDIINYVKNDWNNLKIFVHKYKPYLVPWTILIFISVFILLCMVNHLSTCASKVRCARSHHYTQIGGTNPSVPPPQDVQAQASQETQHGSKTQQATDNISNTGKGEKGKGTGKDKLGYYARGKRNLSSAFGGPKPLAGFSNMLIGAAKGSLMLIGTFLMVAGILSLPVLVFLVLTYYMVKHTLDKITSL